MPEVRRTFFLLKLIFNTKSKVKSLRKLGMVRTIPNEQGKFFSLVIEFSFAVHLKIPSLWEIKKLIP